MTVSLNYKCFICAGPKGSQSPTITLDPDLDKTAGLGPVAYWTTREAVTGCHKYDLGHAALRINLISDPVG